MPRVYNIYKKHPADAVYIGRSSKQRQDGPYGNPFTVMKYGRGKAVELYEAVVRRDSELRAQLKAELTDKDLVCFCAGTNEGLGVDDELKCHGQVILKAIRGDYD